MIECTHCGAFWSANGYTTSHGVIEMPCKACRSDSDSIWYTNNRDEILEARYQDYHDPDKHEAKKAYFAEYRRKERAAKRAAQQQAIA